MPDPEASFPRPRLGFFGWALLLPVVFWLLLFVVAPALILIVYSFCQRNGLGEVVFQFSWENYRRIADPVYLEIFLRSIGYAFLTSVICVLAGYPVAYYIGRSGARWRNVLLLLVMIPFWINFLIRTFAWVTILRSEGMLNAALLQMQVIATPFSMLYTPGAVMLGLVYTYLPFMILPIYGSVEKMDETLVEASLDLGAGPWRTFREVILPLTRPGMVAGMLLVFVPAIGIFGITDLLGGSRVPMIGNVIQNQFLQARDWPFGAALGVALLGLFLLFFFLSRKNLELE